MQLVNTPKQERSRDTQEKLLSALESLLEEKFFEQITIRDIAERADVSTATIYRRFENKEALLPTLYARYDRRLHDWALRMWEQDRLRAATDLESRVRVVVKEHVRFFKKYRHILRTLYIYNRLHGELTVPNVETTRPDIYKQMLLPLWDCLDDSTREALSDQTVRFMLTILLSAVNERFLFSDNKPSSILQIPESVFISELTTTLNLYLLN